jgi:TrmH family RNA methyltransferase
MFQILSRSEERLIRSLHRRKEREAQKLFLAEGVRVVEELLASDLEIRLAVASPAFEVGERGRALLAALQDRTTVRRIDERALAALAGTMTPQGILAVAHIPYTGLEGLRLPAAATILVLDGVQDPGNFGTLARTADALGASALIALPGTVDPWNDKSVRAAAGAAFRLPIVETEFDSLHTWLREQGFSIYGAAAEGGDASKVPIAKRAALFVGNEGAGLSAAARGIADQLLAVPIEPHAESLNVAVATGILLFLLARGR